MSKGRKEKDTTLTPLDLISRLGVFDLDPCAYPNHPTANYLSCWPIDGLSFPWWGRVWCNPPYSDPTPWVERMSQHGSGVMLVLASTDTAWFRKAASSCSCMLFMHGRPTFYKSTGEKVKLMRATVLIEWGGYSLFQSQISGFTALGGAVI